MDSFVPVPSFDSEKFSGSTLILPSVSIGNVPQLTCDLFIHTLHPERVGYIANEAVMPVAGPREGAAGVSLAVEVFQTKDQQWTFIQQRAPTFKGKRRQYVRDLVAFIQKHRFARVIVLTSADATFRTDTQITSAPFRFIGAPVNGIPELESEELLHGTGIGRSLYKALADAHVPVSMVVMFALEGDNVSDSFHLADVINAAAQIRSTQGPWTPPKSWDYLFGLPVNAELYQ
ncbi:PAC2 family-domain-containing protein [Fennellomyces sp. T-0311]|nr:PAC2 family-domain-containing protein [Fennellomyces sp. T-0311]